MPLDSFVLYALFSNCMLRVIYLIDDIITLQSVRKYCIKMLQSVHLCYSYLVHILFNSQSVFFKKFGYSPRLHTYLHPFNGPFSGTTRVSRYQKSKTNLDFTEARDSEWQWHQLGHMHVCISLHTDNHASTPPLKFFCRPDALLATQPIASKHWRQHLLSGKGME